MSIFPSPNFSMATYKAEFAQLFSHCLSTTTHKPRYYYTVKRESHRLLPAPADAPARLHPLSTTDQKALAPGRSLLKEGSPRMQVAGTTRYLWRRWWSSCDLMCYCFSFPLPPYQDSRTSLNMPSTMQTVTASMPTVHPCSKGNITSA